MIPEFNALKNEYMRLVDQRDLRPLLTSTVPAPRADVGFDPNFGLTPVGVHLNGDVRGFWRIRQAEWSDVPGPRMLIGVTG